ncbi:MAG: hypothetical protein ABDH28_03875 [Brevinematia bacterium]
MFLRSLLSGIILGAVLFGVEQVLKRFVPELLEEEPPKPRRSIDIKENEDISMSDIYSDTYPHTSSEEGVAENPSSYDLETGSTTYSSEIGDFKEVEPTTNISEENTFGSVNIGFEEENNIIDFGTSSPPETEDTELPSIDDFSKRESTTATPFKPTTFSTAEIGITRQSKGGTTEDFIIPPKGKPIPKDYKKLAEAIRTKLKED